MTRQLSSRAAGCSVSGKPGPAASSRAERATEFPEVGKSARSDAVTMRSPLDDR
jgi:hypothetical protein